MNDIEIRYITEKEASTRYSLSRNWFQRARWKGEGPSFVKVGEGPRGRVLYPVKETDEWFEKKLVHSTSQY